MLFKFFGNFLWDVLNEGVGSGFREFGGDDY